MVQVGFRDNSDLYSGNATKIDVVANNQADFHAATLGSTVYVVADGNVGDDQFEDFKTYDSLVTHKKIYDSNNDGYIWFGDNDVLDIDRTSSKNAGNDNLSFVGDMRGVRFLGNKAGSTDYVYADAYVRTKLEAFLGHGVTEGTVGDNAFDASKTNATYLYDNALGLNLGSDTITGFGKGDVIVTTVELFDSNKSQSVSFGTNKVLDLAGGIDPTKTGGDVGTSGQINFGYTDPTSLKQIYYLGHEVIDIHGVATDYYFYGGSADTAYQAA